MYIGRNIYRGDCMKLMKKKSKKSIELAKMLYDDSILRETNSHLIAVMVVTSIGQHILSKLSSYGKVESIKDVIKESEISGIKLPDILSSNIKLLEKVEEDILEDSDSKLKLLFKIHSEVMSV